MEGETLNTPKAPGQTAYEAYGDHRRWKTYQGTPMPPWSEARRDIREAWAAAEIAGAMALLAMIEQQVLDLMMAHRESGGTP